MNSIRMVAAEHRRRGDSFDLVLGHRMSGCNRRLPSYPRIGKTHRFARRTGSVLSSWLPIFVSLAAIIGLSVLLLAPGLKINQGSADREPLLVYCAASNKSVLELISQDFLQETGQTVQFHFGPSQTLLTSLEVSRTGDLYLPADDSYLSVAENRGLIGSIFPIAEQFAVVAVRQGNPLKIHTFDDLLRPDVRLAQASFETAAIGKVTRERLLAGDRWESLKEHTAVFKTAVNEVANDVKLGAVDAGIVYNVVLRDYPDLEAVELPELRDVRSRVAIAKLKSSRQPQLADEFAKFVTSREFGLRRYSQFGFAGLDSSSSSPSEAHP